MAKQESKEKKPAKRKLNLSPEERKRRSERMQKLRKEGKVGPEYGKLGGRPKKPRASELLAQEAEKHKDELLSVLKDAIDPNQPIGVRQKALDQWLAIEREERKMEMDEEEHYAKMDREELMDDIAKRLSSNPMMLAMVMDRLSNKPVGADEIEAEVVEEAEVVDD